MTPIVYDFETYWATDHSLSKLSAIEYVMHPETEIQSCSIQIGLDGEAKTYFGFTAIQEVFDTIDWSDALAIAHNNSEFDALILAFRFHIKPKLWACTLAMARPIHAKDAGGSLKGLAKHYGLEEKGSLEAVNTKGKKLADFTTGELAAMREYNDGDTRICAELFKILVRKTPKDEMRLIDMTIRMLVEPQFEADTDLLARGLKAERARKRKVLKELAGLLNEDGSLTLDALKGEDPLSLVQAQLKSAPKFRKLLESLDVTVPMKESPTTGRKIPALAKNDEAFLSLRDHPDELVQAAVEARLDTQSSILETRMDRFIKVAEWCGGKMPIALRYYGADTTGRWSGTMSLNQQNLTRVNPYQPKISDVLRKSFRAPEGMKVVVADLSGIELRVNMFLWKVRYAMDAFESDPGGADLYKLFAAESLYHVDVDDVTKQQRQVGKVAHLGLGFGAGYITFQTVAKLMGGVELDEEESRRIVDAYRNKHHQIKQGWRTCHAALDFIKQGVKQPIDPWGMCTTCKEGIKTPKGIIRYPNLRQETKDGDTEWVYGEGRRKARIYAGKVTENIVQHLARNVMADMALEINKLVKFPLAHTVHDELIYVVPDRHADRMLALVNKVMRKGVDWWPELITWSEGDVAQTYGDAK